MNLAALTHAGCQRTYNQDRHLAHAYDNGAILLAVADGMGGVAGGEMAAELAVEQIGRLDPARPQPGQMLLELVHRAEKTIMARAGTDPDRPDMGTTLTAVLALGGQAHWVHVGDSRLYHLTEGNLRRVTRDQNMVQFLVDEGELTPEQAQGHPMAGFLDQCVGCGDCRPAFGVFPLAPADLLLVCSDGLHGVVSDPEIAETLGSGRDLEARAQDLMDLALERQAPDNVTLVLAQV